MGLDSVELTAGPLGVAELDVTAGAGGVLSGSLRGEQVIDLSVEGLDGGIDLVVLGSHGGLISSVLIISRNIVSTTRGARRSGQTGRSRRTLIWITEWKCQILSLVMELVYLLNENDQILCWSR